MSDFLQRLGVRLGYCWHSGFNPVNADLRQLLGNGDFVRDAEDHPRSLFAVAQRSVMDAHALRQLELLGYLRNEVIRAYPPLVFTQILLAHLVTLSKN